MSVIRPDGTAAERIAVLRIVTSGLEIVPAHMAGPEDTEYVRADLYAALEADLDAWMEAYQSRVRKHKTAKAERDRLRAHNKRILSAMTQACNLISSPNGANRAGEVVRILNNGAALEEGGDERPPPDPDGPVCLMCGDPHVHRNSNVCDSCWRAETGE